MNNQLLAIYILVTIVQIVISLVCYLSQRKKISKLEFDRSNHHQFLLKVKNDVPQLWARVNELEEQILPPPDNKLH